MDPLKLVLIFILCWNLSSSYLQYSYMIPMSDGTELYTLVYVPDGVPTPRSSVYHRTPYGTDTLIKEGAMWAENGYNAVMQDFRGRYLSQGKFDFWFNDSTDAYTTMEWIASQAWSNQKVFTTGASADGIAQYFEQMTAPKWLVAQSVTVGSSQTHSTVFQQGAYRHSLIDKWLGALNESWWTPILQEHEAYSSYWESEDLALKTKNIRQPAIHMGGWYDIFQQPTLNAYNLYQFESSNPGNSFLIMLPGGHCQGGQVNWPNATFGIEIATQLTAGMFNKLSVGKDLKSEIENAAIDIIYYYILGPGTSGSIGNIWASLPTQSFPNPDVVSLYLQPGNTLIPQPVTSGSVSFVYNPNDPVPTMGGNNLMIECGPIDQSSLYSRADIVSFTSPVLDADYFILGELQATLYVSSNATDTDFTVKLIDVYPEGYHMNIQDGIIRMKWRDDPSVPNLMVPGEVYAVNISIWSTSYIFNKGHRVQLDISSSNYPRFSANPNNGLPLSETGPLIYAENTIYYGPKYPSSLQLPVVGADAIKELDDTTLVKLKKWAMN